jgi:cellulose synthase/poly-beta-1,6-N-acetylglucosamine synthase-like glycosyltransferase
MTVLATSVFLISSALLVYVVVGYPLVLAMLARKFARPFQRDERLRSVSIVIAVRNGEKFVADKLNSILALDYPRELMEILVVSDGSDDSTDTVTAGFADRGVSLWRIPRSGKAAALNLGISKARNEILILTDVRQKLATDSVRRLVGCFGDSEVGVASGELSILKGVTDEETDTRLYWNYEVWIRKQMSTIDSTFGANGPFYAMRRNLAVSIPEDTLLDDVYLPLAAFFKGYRIVLDDSAKAFDYPTGLGSEFQRKVRTQAGLFQILKAYPQMLTSKNRMRFHFLSGKYGRPMMPWLLLLVAISSCGLPEPFALWTVGFQGVFYGLAAIDRFVPSSFPLKRMTSPIRTFVMLVLSSVVAVKIFFVPPRDLWKETKVRKVGTL